MLARTAEKGNPISPRLARRRLTAYVSLLLAGVTLTACGGGSAGAPPSSLKPTLIDRTAVGAGLAGVGTLPSNVSAWPAAACDARHSGTARATGPQAATVKWQALLGGAVTPGPVVETDGSIVAATDAGVLYDLDAATGAQVWSFDGGATYGSEELSTSPAVLADGTILWPGPKNTLYAVSSSGTLLWKQALGAMVLSPAVAGADRVYVSDLSGHLTAFDITATSHAMVWSLDLGGDTFASPTVGPDGTIYTSSTQDLVAVRDLGPKGAIEWRLHSPKKIEVSAGVGSDGTVVMGTNDGGEYGVAPDGSITWSFALGDNTFSSSVVAPDHTTYFGDNDGQVWVADTSTGTVRSHLAPEKLHTESIYNQVAVDKTGDYYWATTKGNLYGYDSSDKQLWTMRLDGPSFAYPAIDGAGTLYVGTEAGTLYAIGS